MNIINEYIISNFLYIQIIPVLAGIVCYSRLEKSYQLFVWILGYTVLSEIFKIYYGTYIDIGQNRIWTNLYNVIYFSFLFWIFIKKSDNELFKKGLKIIIFCYFLSIGFEVFVQKINYHSKSQVIPYIIGGTTVIIYVFNYLLSVLKSKKITAIYNDFLFWFLAAHFIYFLAYTPFKIGENYFSNEDFLDLFKIKIGGTLLKSIFLSIGFLWTTQNRK